MKRLAALALSSIALPLALAGGLAHAQIAPNSKAPVDITADQLQVQNHLCLASWRGNAEALQDTSRLRADTLDIYNKVLPNPHPGAAADSSPNCGQLDHMIADGNVYYVTPERVVKGDHAVYTADDTTIVMTGANVVATQGKNVVAGTRLVINTTTGEANMVSDVTGRGKPNRVRAVLYPQEGAQASGQAPAKSDAAPKKHAKPSPAAT